MLKLVDISYGGENGFNQAIELSAEVLSNVKFIQEKKLIGWCRDQSKTRAGGCFWKRCDFCINNRISQFCQSPLFECFSCLSGRYFDEISQDTGKYCFGVEDTLKALEMGAVEILIVYENLDTMRYILRVHGAEGNGAENGTHKHPYTTIMLWRQQIEKQHRCTQPPRHTHKIKHFLCYSTGLFLLDTYAMSIHRFGYTLRCGDVYIE